MKRHVLLSFAGLLACLLTISAARAQQQTADKPITVSDTAAPVAVCCRGQP